MRTIFLLLLLIPSVCMAQSDALRLVQKASDNVLELKSIEYEFVNERYYGNGQFSRTKTEVLFKRTLPVVSLANREKRRQGIDTDLSIESDGYNFERIKGTIYNSEKGSERSIELYLGREELVKIDHRKKIVQAMPSDINAWSWLELAAMDVLGATFDHFWREDPLNSLSKKYRVDRFEAEELHGGVMCYVVSMPYKADRFYWYIGKEDTLPRGYRFEKGMMEATIKRTNFNPDDKVFNVMVPEGYKKETYDEEYVSPNRPVNLKASTEDIAYPKGSTLPEWSAKDITGKLWNSDMLKGKIVVYDFWGTWCAPCIRTMPKIQELHEKFADQEVTVVGFSVKDDPIKAANFMKKRGYDYLHIPNADKIARQMKVTSYPTLFIVDQNGVVLHAESGYRPNGYEEWVQIIQDGLKKKQGR